MSGKRDLFIGGQWVAANKKATFPVYNPSTGEVWAQVADASRNDAAAAIAAAAAAQPAWAALTHSKRAQLLSKVADVLAARQKEFQESLIDEGGAWVGKTMFETGYSIGVYRAAAAAAYQVTGEILPSDHGKMSLVVREPLGVVSVISPWNFPLILSSRGFATALAVGNTVVLKPSEETPVSGGLLIAEVLEEAGIPPGRVQRRDVLTRQRRRRRRRADLEPGRARHQLHGLDGHRQPSGGQSRRVVEEVLRRARRQGRTHRPRRRRHRACRECRDVRLVHAPGADLHVRRAHHRPQRRRQRIHREVRRQYEEAQGRQPARDGELHRAHHQSEAARQDPRPGRRRCRQGCEGLVRRQAQGSVFRADGAHRTSRAT